VQRRAMRAATGRIRDSGTVRREGRVEFVEVIIRKLNRISIWKKLDVNLSRAEESIRAADESQHASVRRKSRRGGGVGKAGQWRVRVLSGASGLAHAQPDRGTRGERNQD